MSEKKARCKRCGGAGVRQGCGVSHTIDADQACLWSPKVNCAHENKGLCSASSTPPICEGTGQVSVTLTSR